MITDIWMRPVGQALNRYAGQFAFVQFNSKAVDSEPHPFTIAAGSSEERLRFCIKNLGDYTEALQNLKVGDLATVEGPYGYFSFTKILSRKQVWVAGGIGITPFLAMAYSIPSDLVVTLYYCVTNPQEAVFLKELQAIAQAKKGFTVVPHYSDTQGFITAKRLIESKPQDYLLCGPAGMMNSLKAALLKTGTQPTTIHYEEFQL